MRNQTGQPPTRRQLRRWYTWLGMFCGAAGTALAAMLLSRFLQGMPWYFYIWMHHLQGLSIITIAVLLALAVWRAALLIRCEEHMLLALAEILARKEK